MQKKQDIKRKISERELLIEEAKKNDELLVTAQETLEYFTSMQRLDQLDEADTEQFEELQTLVSSLEEQRLKIEEGITAISNHPKILERLHDTAQKEDVERAIESLIEQANAELEPQIDQLATAIKNLASQKVSLWQSIEQQQKTTSNAQNEVWDVFNRAVDILHESSDFGITLRKAFEEFEKGESLERLQQKLTEERESLGILKGKEKATIDFILAQDQVLDKYYQAAEQLSALNQQQETLKIAGSSRSDQLKKIMGKAWETQDKISELGGLSPKLPTSLWYRLERNIKEFADVEHWSEEKGIRVGKHESWFKATQTREGRILYETWESVTKNAGGYKLTESSPNKPEQESKE